MRTKKPLILCLALALWACCPVHAQVTTLNLMDFGAVGDNQADDGPALQAALNALAQAGGGTLIVPAGHYAIQTPVAVDFTARASSITILGVESSTPVVTTAPGSEISKSLDLVSEFFPKTGSAQSALRITGLETFLIKHIAFIGTPNVQTDALITLVLDQIESATVRHCEFYGLSTQTGSGAIVFAGQSRLTIDQSKFLGSTGNSGAYIPVVQNYRWKGITVTNTAFVDYGQRPELYGKMTVAPISWINLGNAAVVTPESPRREVVINVGDVLIKISYRGAASNRVRMGIGHIGGGPPDDVGSIPTPGSAN